MFPRRRTGPLKGRSEAMAVVGIETGYRATVITLGSATPRWGRRIPLSRHPRSPSTEPPGAAPDGPGPMSRGTVGATSRSGTGRAGQATACS